MNSPKPCSTTPVLSIQVIATATALRIKISGEVDLTNRDTLKAALDGIDFASADAVQLACDSSRSATGCSALIWFERESRLSGHPTHIRGATRTVQLVLTLLAHGDVPTFV